MGRITSLGSLIHFAERTTQKFHIMCRRAGVDFHFSKSKSIRLIQALKAMLVGIWMVVDMLEKHLASQSADQS